MQKIANKKLCSGCQACCNACPKQCITMTADNEGFLYPHIEQEKCIDCGLCRRVCPALKEYKGNPKGEAFACINKDDAVRMKSSSGGIFTLLAEYVIDNGGVVFGAAFTDDCSEVRHICISNKEDLDRLRGSKYVQSRIGDTYREVREFLNEGKLVLFTGTPCQISGIKAYLGKTYDNLILQDIVCHGVPSTMVWQKYIEYRCRQSGSPLSGKPPFFRDKSIGWTSYSVSMDFENGTRYISRAGHDLYMKAFVNNLCLRPSCYNCHSKSFERQSDITLADFWGIDNIEPAMNDNKGTSLVFINSEKGKRLFNELADRFEYKAVDIDKAASYNSAVFKSSPRSVGREQFMDDIKELSFDKAVKKHIKDNKLRKYISALKRKVFSTKR